MSVSGRERGGLSGWMVSGWMVWARERVGGVGMHILVSDCGQDERI